MRTKISLLQKPKERQCKSGNYLRNILLVVVLATTLNVSARHDSVLKNSPIKADTNKYTVLAHTNTIESEVLIKNNRKNFINLTAEELELLAKPQEEPEMKLAPWMINTELFWKFFMELDVSHNPLKYATEVEEEKELIPEAWMLDKDLFCDKFKDIELRKD